MDRSFMAIARRSGPTLGVGLLALAAWALAARLWPGPSLPGPGAVVEAAWILGREGHLARDVGASLVRVLVGYGAAAVAGVALGALASALGRWGRGLGRVLEVLRPIPPIAWIPLAILWFGLGDHSAWFIVFVGAFFPIFSQVAWALSACPEPWLELARSLGASRRQVLLRVRLPAAMPHVLAGLRTGLGLAWTSLIAAELVGAQDGLGYRIQMHRLVLETEGVMVGMLCIGILGAAMGALARWAERRLVPWASP